MTRYDVTSPVENYNGEVGGVKFYKGRAVVDSDTHGAAVAYMRRRRYTLTPITETAPEAPEPETTDSRQDSGSPDPGCECQHSPCEHQQSDDEDEGSGFDPGEHSAPDVNEYLSGVDLRERERVLQAEAEGKSRLTVLNGPHSDLSGLKPEDKEQTS